MYALLAVQGLPSAGVHEQLVGKRSLLALKKKAFLLFPFLQNTQVRELGIFFAMTTNGTAELCDFFILPMINFFFPLKPRC